MEDGQGRMLFKEIRLTSEEAERWIRFHENAYKGDERMALRLVAESPRWSVIIAYYAMHNASKLYLARVHNPKISGREVHAQTLFFISKYIKQESRRVIPLLRRAKEEYDAITSSSVWPIPQMLSKGRDERAKTQYYDASRSGRSDTELMQAAQYFNDNFMVPYLRIIEGLL